MTSLLVLFLFLLVLVFFLRFRELQKTVAQLSARLATLERGPEKGAVQPNESRKNLLPQGPPAASKPAAVKPPPRPPRPPIDWEQFLGVKLFAWLGGLALFLGVALLVKYSFENNLITPLGRIVIGGAVGGTLVAGGWWLARGRYGVTARSLCATGIVILYADIFAAHSFYTLVSLTTAFFAMSAVTVGSFLLAVNLSAQVIVILGLLGGFLTPVLLPSGADNARSLFLYVALLDLGVAAVALRRRWLHLVLLAAIGTALTQLDWAFHFFNATKGGQALWIFLGFEALFLVLFFLRGRLSANKWLAAAAAVAGFTALGFLFWLSALPALARQPLFFFSFVFLADAGLLALPVIGRAHRVFAWAAGGVAFILVAEWIELFAPQTPVSASLLAIVAFALLHAATTSASAWRSQLLPFTATGTITPFLLLIILIQRVALWNPTPVFAVALILTAILLAAAIVKRADWLAVAALLGSGLTELAWQGLRFSGEQAIPALVCYGLLLALFVVFPFCSAEKEKAWCWAISALAQVLAFWLFNRAIAAAFPNEWMGLLAAVFVLPGALGLFALLKLYRANPASGDARLAWQGGALLLFVSLIFPLQFDREWITLGWALEGLALFGLFHRVPHRGLRLVAVLLLGAAFCRLAFNPAVLEYHKRSATHIWNWYLYAYGLTTACLLTGAAVFGNPIENSLERAAPPFLGSLGTVLAFLLLNIEIADYFSSGPTLTFSFSGNFARDMTYSIAWALFALGLILVGMRIKQRAARYAGVALLGVTLAKLFLHDLNDLDELYRIGAFVSVAVILIAASFIYQSFLVPGRATK
ncbi:MAG: DUF2339 domain-containing protein [Solirubrobacterales bacterium]|nr:DUF2339 domain-containing protein [Solirubrobacterales bacterium]